MRIVKLNEQTRQDILASLLKRDPNHYSGYEEKVQEIVENVKDRRDQALLEYTRKFDGVELTADQLRVTEEEVQEALSMVEPSLLSVMKKSMNNIREYHEKQKQYSWFDSRPNGTILGQKVTPLASVGVYVPGGKAAYPSSVLMNIIPAKVAGVERIVMVTPPGKDGKVNPVTLAAAHLAGVTDAYKVGGAQAVAALAFGTESISKVDKIAGPGNIFVALAKKAVYGHVSIDSIAGPSEILVLADEKSDPGWVAADLLSQAEHDVLASPVLVTDSRELAESVQRELERQLESLPRRDVAHRAVEDNGKILVTDSLDKAVEAVNRIAPEHLELCVDDPFALLPRIKNAGSVFLGRSTPEALGDYFAGPNHTLPTSGTARFSSPLGVDDFMKRSSFLSYDQAALNACGDRIADFARREGLEGHARSAESRKKSE